MAKKLSNIQCVCQLNMGRFTHNERASYSLWEWFTVAVAAVVVVAVVVLCRHIHYGFLGKYTRTSK